MSLKISYCKEGIRQYMVIESGGDGTAESLGMERAGFEEKMMEGQDSAFLLDFHARSIDGARKYYYDITGLVDMDTSISKGSVSMQELETIIRSVCSACEDLGRFLLDADSLLLDSGCVYRDPEKKFLRLAYIPGCTGNFAAGMEAFAARLLGNVDYRDDLSVILAYDLYRCTSLPDFSVKSLEALLEPGIRKAGKNGLDSYDQKSHALELRNKEITSGQSGTAGIKDRISRLSIEQGEGLSVSGTGLTESMYRIDNENEGKEKGGIPGSAASNGNRNAQVSGIPGSSERDKGAGGFLRDRKGQLALLACTAAYCLAIAVLWRLGYLSMAADRIGLRSFVLLGILMGAGCALALLIWMLTGKEKGQEASSTDASWDLYAADHYGETRDEDSEPFSAGGWTGEGETVLLSRHMLVPGDRPEIKLVSLNREISGDICIQQFPVVIGSSNSQSQILLEIPGVSRSHALLEREEGVFFLSDLHSTNGTLLNGKRLVPDRRCRLNENDQVSFAQIPFQIKVVGLSR